MTTRDAAPEPATFPATPPAGLDPVVDLEHQLGLEVRRDVRVKARDGIELSVNLFLPRRPAGAPPMPAILNIDPYRKDDWQAGWDLALASYLAGHGYAYCRLDVRGTGSSGGVALDEYTEAETLDGHDTVEWLAAQPWCSGAIGMWGLSYGGFTSIQVAATRPPHLRAIVPIQATDDRYTDDVHYVGGAMTVSELSQYAVSQVAMNALPALSAAWGDEGLERWRARLAATPVWLFRWAREQRDGPYWRRGSLAPDYGRIEAAVLHLSGWMDEYVDAALRMQARCLNAAGRRTIIGPWVHGLPDHAYPAPNIDWRREMVRWFDRWLKDERNGADTEPALTWFHRDPSPPERFPARLNGEWRATAAWPRTNPSQLVLVLDADDAGGRLVSRAGVSGGDASSVDGAHADGVDTFAHKPTAGVHGGSLCWGAGHPPNGLAADLRLEAGNGPTYTSAPLESAIDVLGVPVAVLHVASSRPVADLVVRLGSVAPDGSVEQVSEGILNLTHRDSHANPTPLEPGRRYEVRVAMRGAGYRFPPGHRIQLSVASAHWPVIWPSPGAGDLSIHRGPGAPSRLELPLAPEGEEVAAVPALDEDPQSLPEIGSETSEPVRWETVENPETGTVTVRTHEAATSTLPDGVSTLYVGEALAMTASAREPGAGRFENACDYRLDRDGRLVSVVADGTTIATATAFDMTVRIRVELDGEPFFERTWHEEIARDLA
ncbi:MAG TPA: CocE/NonD family hydrolase [Candidatus Limnocylindria bacterium]|nr:CocE/NonD family hydrolase [Candidatus Limnocylindria bacterium]